MEIEIDLTPDAVGYGRLIVMQTRTGTNPPTQEQRFYGLPVAVLVTLKEALDKK